VTKGHPGRVKLVLGAILFFIGAFLSTINTYAGDATFYAGLGLIVWGTVVYFQRRKATKNPAALLGRQALIRKQAVANIQAQIPRGLSPPPLQRATGSPTALTPPSRVQTTYAGSPTVSPIPGESPDGPSTYAVEFSIGGKTRTASFRTFNPANEFFQHGTGESRLLIRITPDGRRWVLAPLPSGSPPVPIPKAVPPKSAQFDRVAEFLDRFQPSDRFGREREYEIELAQALRTEFGRLHVRRQVPIPQGIIDIEVCGIGIELKIAGTPGSVQRLAEQTSGYREHFGPNLMAVVFDDTGDEDGMAAVKRTLETRGTRVFLK